MRALPTEIPDVVIIEPDVFEDLRGHFFESFNQRDFHSALGRDVHFVQENHSRSHRHVLRGLHYQTQNAQGKLVRVVSGAVFDVAVDLRRDSPTFLAWHAEELSAENARSLFIPKGFAHGFQTLADDTELLYLHTTPYVQGAEGGLNPADTALAIAWPLAFADLSARDAAHPFIPSDFRGV